MIGSSFKPETDIFKNLGVIPKTFVLENYKIGWQSNGRVTFSTYFFNSIMVSVLCVLGNLLSCTLAAYAFARLRFKCKNLMFVLMMMTLMLPQHAIIVPQYVYFYKMGWIDTIIPLVLPKFLATDAFFVYLLIQFIKGIPRELDEAAIVDGCSSYGVFFKIILPLCQPALVTTTIFTFMWSWNDFFTQIIYLRTADKYTVTLALRMFVDSTAKSAYGAMFAMSTLSIIPILILFIFFQKQLIEGVATSGLKG
ncbi:MAG TPA: carbohydrate ABC transporter permease [Candidatus Pelethocola excrementipullorum]|nr:carbohydrate ABC transporter permease [Candidatus Pelethocola excrementipullorum]